MFTDQFQCSEYKFKSHFPKAVQNRFLFISYTHSRHPLPRLASIPNVKKPTTSSLIIRKTSTHPKLHYPTRRPGVEPTTCHPTPWVTQGNLLTSPKQVLLSHATTTHPLTVKALEITKITKLGLPFLTPLVFNRRFTVSQSKSKFIFCLSEKRSLTITPLMYVQHD